MLSSTIVRIVDFCVQRRWQVVIFGILLAIACATYDVRRFAITTDTDSLISQRLPWHQRQAALAKEFETTPEACRPEVETFLNELAERGAVALDG